MPWRTERNVLNWGVNGSGLQWFHSQNGHGEYPLWRGSVRSFCRDRSDEQNQQEMGKEGLRWYQRKPSFPTDQFALFAESILVPVWATQFRFL